MKDYARHIPKSMLANRFKVLESDVLSLVVGETVYQIRERPGTLLNGHTFHKSHWFDRDTLECRSIEGDRLLAKVERIK